MFKLSQEEIDKMKLYVIIKDFLIDFDWGSEVIGIYDNPNKAQNICDKENLKVQKEYEEKRNIEHTKIWTEEDHYENNVDYYYIEEFILNKNLK